METNTEFLTLQITENHGRTWSDVKFPVDISFLSIVDFVKKNPCITDVRFRSSNLNPSFAKAITILPPKATT